MREEIGLEWLTLPRSYCDVGLGGYWGVCTGPGMWRDHRAEPPRLLTRPADINLTIRLLLEGPQKPPRKLTFCELLGCRNQRPITSVVPGARG